MQKELAATAEAMPDASSKTQVFVGLARVLSITQPQLYRQNMQLIQQAYSSAEAVTDPVGREQVTFTVFSARNAVLAAYVNVLAANGQQADAQKFVGFFAEWSKTAQAGANGGQSALVVAAQELPLQRALGNTQRVQQIVQTSIKHFEETPGYGRVEQMMHFAHLPTFWENTRFQELLQQARQDLLAGSDESGQLRPDALRPMAALALLYYRAGQAQDGANLEKWLTVELDTHNGKVAYQRLQRELSIEKAIVHAEHAQAAGDHPARDAYAAEVVSLLP